SRSRFWTGSWNQNDKRGNVARPTLHQSVHHAARTSCSSRLAGHHGRPSAWTWVLRRMPARPPAVLLRVAVRPKKGSPDFGWAAFLFIHRVGLYFEKKVLVSKVT